MAFAACILGAQQSGPQAPSAQPTSAPQANPKQPSSSATVPESSGKVSVETKMVTVYATVRDKHGKIVPALNKENFTLTEDEHPQTIRYFVRETDLPLTLGLLVDTSMSQANVLDSERTASFTFLDHMMREEKDQSFVIHFDHEVELLQDVTQSKPKLQAALQLLSTAQSDGTNQSQSGGRGQRRGYGASGTHLYDAIYLASHDVMLGQKGRKAIFVLTDGVDHGSKETLAEAVEAAQRADTAVYSLYFAGEESSFARGSGHGGGMGRGGGWPEGYPGGHGGGRYPQQEERADGKKVLEKLSTETGGQLFEISKKLPIDQAYAEAEEELRNQYSLGYTPAGPDTGAGYHRLKLTVDQKDDSVQARDGYYSD